MREGVRGGGVIVVMMTLRMTALKVRSQLANYFLVGAVSTDLYNPLTRQTLAIRS